MARLKKKASRPTPEPGGPETEPAVSGDTPEIAKPVPEEPPAGPQMGESDRSENGRKLTKLFWMRVSLAVIAGTAATFIFEDIQGEDRRWASIVFMIGIFLGTIIVAKGMRMQLPSSDRKKIVTQGIGSYVFMYLFVWILTYTLANSGSATSGIPTPFS